MLVSCAAHTEGLWVGGATRLPFPTRHRPTHHSLCLPQALLETALTRVVLPMPILVIPPIFMSMLEK